MPTAVISAVQLFKLQALSKRTSQQQKSVSQCASSSCRPTCVHRGPNRTLPEGIQAGASHANLCFHTRHCLAVPSISYSRSPHSPRQPLLHTPRARTCRAPSKRQFHHRCHAQSTNQPGSGDTPSTADLDDSLDANQLQTMLNTAIAAEDYALATRLRDRLQLLVGKEGAGADWRKLGVPDWLADRLERLAFRFPTEVQKRAARVLLDKSDAIIQSETGSGKTLSFLVPLLSILDYPPLVFPDDLEGPQCVLIVPTKELGVQMALLIYKLFGGSLNPGIPGNTANLFTYQGPRGIKVRGCLDKEEVLMARNAGSLKGVHVVVVTPACLAEVTSEPNGLPIMQTVKAVAVDEVDACFQEQSQAMEMLLTAACGNQQKPVIAFNGATIQEGLAEQAVQMGWMVDPVTVRVGRAGQVPSGLQHRYIVIDPQRRLAVLCRQIRKDLRAEGPDLPPPRVMVFADSEEDARDAAPPLRSVLWGDHKMSVLLPKGEEPILAMHDFRDNKVTLLLATPAAARGLDLPAVSHVYNMGLPEDATGYLHRAGRAGRIGSPVKGIITTLVTKEQVPSLLRLTQQLEVDIQELPEPALEMKEGDVESTKRDLEDIFNLF